MTNSEQVRITYRQLLSFFIPLGISSALVTISHVIINSTLARSAHPEFIIASYALPMSILGITERPAVLLRQTCSALVRDRVSFRAMSLVSLCGLGGNGRDKFSLFTGRCSILPSSPSLPSHRLMLFWEKRRTFRSPSLPSASPRAWRSWYRAFSRTFIKSCSTSIGKIRSRSSVSP